MISNLELLKQELIKDLLEKQESGFLKKQMWNYEQNSLIILII